MATRGRAPRRSKYRPKSGRKTVTVKAHPRSPRKKGRQRVRRYRRNAPPRR